MLCEGHPELWAGIGNLAGHAQTALIRAIAAENTVVAEAIARQAAELRRGLAGAEPSPLEWLVVGRVVACWLQLHYAEARYAQNLGKLTMEQGEYHQLTIDRAQKRYLAAIKALAQVRRLLTPAVQVNIADQQINIAQ